MITAALADNTHEAEHLIPELSIYYLHQVIINIFISINTANTNCHNMVKMFYMNTKYIEVHMHSSALNTQQIVKYLEYKNLSILLQAKGNTLNSNYYSEAVQ